MATQDRTYAPAAGRAKTDLTSWAGSLSFSTTPVSGDQLEHSSALTVSADGTYTGPAGNYTFHLLKANGNIYTAGGVIEAGDSDPPTLIEASGLAFIATQIVASVETNELNGTLYAYISSNASESSTTIKATGQTKTPDSFVENFTFTGLTGETTYYVHFVQVDAAGNESNVTRTPAITTPGASESASTVRQFAPPGGDSVAELVSGFETYPFEDWPSGEPAVGWQFVYDPDEYQVNSLAQFTTELVDVYDIWVVDLNGVWYYQTVDFTGLSTISTADISAITLPADATYGVGDQLDFVLTYSEDVTVTGSPRIPLVVDGASYYAVYLSGSGTSSVTFRWVVPADITDNDGIELFDIDANGGSIIGQDSLPASVTLPTHDSSGILIDSFSPPAGTITFGAATKTGTTITQPFVYSAGDATGFQYRVDGAGLWVDIAASPVSLTGLTESTEYTIEVRAVNEDGQGTAASTSVTTNASTSAPTGTVTIGTPVPGPTSATIPFTYSASDQTGFQYRIDGGSWVAIAASPVLLTGLDDTTEYTIEVRAVNADGASAADSETFTTTSPATPQGVITYGTPSTTKNLATVPFTYDLSDQTGFQFRVDGGSWTALAGSPVALAGLNPATSYLIEVRAVNAAGSSAEFPITVTTQALSPPAGVVAFLSPTIGQTTASLPFTYSSTDQTGFQYRVDGSGWITISGSPVALVGLQPQTSYTIEVAAVNDDGIGSVASIAVTTLAEQVSVESGSSNTYDFNLAVEEIIEDAYERIGITTYSGYDLKSARRSLNLLLTEWVNRDITLWTTERRSIQCVAGQASYDLRQYDVDAFEVALRTSGADFVLTRVSMDQSMYTVNKEQTGRPVQYWFDRDVVPKLILWPVPDNSTYSLLVDVFKYIQDVGQYFNFVGAPRRFLPAMVAGLAYRLAEKRNPQVVAEKKALYDEALNQALAADEEVKSFTVRPAGSRRYRRR